MKIIVRMIMGFVILFPNVAMAQNDSLNKGIKFENSIGWDELKLQAKRQNKYILVDCYTTWCGPCKKMDKFVYTDDKVAKVVSANFIPFKLQMDKTVNDSQDIKKMYSVAEKVEKQYSVSAYPTYLFFSPEGKLVHRATGAVSAEKFISVALDALDSNKQYYTLLEKYNLTTMDSVELRETAMTYRHNGPELAAKCVMDYFERFENKNHWSGGGITFIEKFQHIPAIQEYVNKYFNNLKDVDFFSKEMITCLFYFTKKVSDRGFAIFYKYPEKCDSAMGSGAWSTKIAIGEMIYKEIAISYLKKAANESSLPKWSEINNSVEKKYGRSYALYVQMRGKINWYELKKDSAQLLKANMDYLDKFILWETDLYLNNQAWNFFLKYTDSVKLQKALKWSEQAIRLNPTADWIDTYSNLLYKLGKRNQAILWEKVAVKIAKNGVSIKENLEKMQSGAPTW